jgi:YD repeat-containing protein
MLKFARSSTNSLRLLAILTLLAMIMPMIVVEKVRASAAIPTPAAPPSAPPEPFIIGTSEPSRVFLAPYLTAIGGFFSTPKLPEGFEMAKVPTLTDKVSPYVGSFLGLFSGSVSSTAAAPAPPPPPPAAPVDFDFDNDGKSDLGRWHPTTTEFKVKNSNGGSYSTFTLGAAGAKAAPGDYDGDGNTDACVFLNGAWTYKTSPGASAQTMNWGMSDDIPVPGNYEGSLADSKTDFAIFRPSSGVWWIYRSSNSTYYSVTFGTSSDIVTPGDYDGDGKNDPAFFRPSTGDWHINGSLSGYYSAHWGATVDTPVPADYDGDGKTDMAVYRPTTGEWFAYKSQANDGSYLSATWGNYGDQPVPGYYDSDNKADFAIWRPTTGGWYIVKSTGGYDYQVLGVPGDQAVPSAYIKQVGSTVSTNDLNAVRLSPKNATGGTDLYSQNFSWSTGLVGLPGRSGLDAGFGMSYNSLVWIKQGSAVVFDADTSNISPGFRFGFPVIEPVYYDSSGGKNTFAYFMVTPSGGRVQFRQTAVSNTYETADSSYTQLVVSGARSPNDPVEDITIRVKSTDGTQMTYGWKAGAFRCKEIKDRNGNYITITHNDYGGLATVTDTLGRVVTVNYASGEAPSSITQTWKDSNGSGSNVTSTWETFTYTTLQIDTDFSGVTVFGPPDGSYISVLQKITHSDGSHTDFAYNSYGQVYKVSNIAADSTSHVLNSIRTNLQSPASSQTDCPRFTETKTFVENFNGGNEITINNSLTAGQSYSLPGGISGTASRIQVWMTNHPDNLRTNMFVASSGWQEGLAAATEDCLTTSSTCSDRKRWTWTEWTQDNGSVSYPLNPRVIESRVGDSSNVKKTTIDYRTVSGVVTYGLPETVKTYDSDLTTVLKQSYTQYVLDSAGNLDPAYISRRIIGLPFKTEVSGLDSTGFHLVSKMTYAYDQGNFSDSGLSQNISPTQHDNTNYSSSLTTGRGNLTSATRWDVTDPDGSGSAITSSMKYNTAGSVVSKTDPLSRTIKIAYNESVMFNDGITNRATYAYPTSITDPANNSSTVKYRFDLGANVEATSPAPAGNTYGKTTKRIYDSLGRLERDSVYIGTSEYSYFRMVYPTNGIQSQIYVPVVDADGDGSLGEDEVLTESWTDGTGRVLRTRAPHPGSSGGWTATINEYNILGGSRKTSVPTEISVSGSTWTPAGDDATRGWIWNEQQYDWKGRVTRIIPSDSNGSDGKDQLFSYEGCGCAGGEIITIESESVPVPGESYSARRVQKIYADILGRDYKTEVYNWDGYTVYNTTVRTFNARDQITKTRQYAGGTSAAYQDVSMTYDGHGRVKTRHYPIEDTYTDTTWNYNADGSVGQVIDPRLAITDYTYNSRGLVTDIDYTPPANYPPANSPAYMEITDTPSVDYTYDNLGNRTGMTDGSGSVSYEFDALSRLTAETRYLTDSLSNAPTYQSSQAFRIAYEYNLSGGLKKVTDPYGIDVNYTYDATGRLTAVGGEAYGDNTTGEYVEGIQYRAFGSPKQMTYKTDDEAVVGLQYDNRLRTSAYEVATNVVSFGYMKKSSFTYYNDSKPESMADYVDDKFDRTFKYDHMGRLKENHIGPAFYNPYDQSITYDAFSQMTNRVANYWENTSLFNSTFSNGRESTQYVTGTAYDAAGNQINSGTQGGLGQTRQYDAVNRNIVFTSQYKRRTGLYSSVTMTNYTLQDFDGDGRKIKVREKVNTVLDPTLTKYQIWSTPLNGYLTDVSYTGTKRQTNVYADGAILAEQVGMYTSPIVAWIHADPVTGSSTRVNKDGTLWYRKELEPLGQEINPYGGDGDFPSALDRSSEMRDAFDPHLQCAFEEAKQAAQSTDSYRMPEACKNAAFETNYDIYITWEPKGNPKKINEQAEGILTDFNYSGSDNTLALAKNATNKPDDKKKKKKETKPCTPGEEVTFDDGRVGICNGSPTLFAVVNVKISFERRVIKMSEEVNKHFFNFSLRLQPLIELKRDRKPGPCAMMANTAQQIANQVLQDYPPGAELEREIEINGSMDPAVRHFDQQFTSRYIGTAVNNLTSAAQLGSNGGRVGTVSVGPEEIGQSDFKEAFLESGVGRFDTATLSNMLADQVHHAAAYLSMGINGQNLVRTYHMYGDNGGDARLGNAAFNVGSNLNRSNLSTIGSTMRSAFCE